jgi:serine/threonine-protein kinase
VVNVARPAGQSGECDRFLYLTGGYGVVVSATTDISQSGAASVNLCAIADTATSSAVTALDHGPLRRRAAASASLVHADACRLLNASALSAVPGANAADHQAGFGDFSCQWASTSSGTSVFLRFDQNDPLGGSDGTLMQLGGRQAYVQPGGDSNDTSNCLAQVVYRSFSGATGPTEELLYLVVDGSQGYSDKANSALCRQATTLAAAASTALTE